MKTHPGHTQQRDMGKYDIAYFFLLLIFTTIDKCQNNKMKTMANRLIPFTDIVSMKKSDGH